MLTPNPELPQSPYGDVGSQPEQPTLGGLRPPMPMGLGGGMTNYTDYLRQLFGSLGIGEPAPAGEPPVAIHGMGGVGMPTEMDQNPGQQVMYPHPAGPAPFQPQYPMIHPAVLAALHQLPEATRSLAGQVPPPSSPMHNLTSHDLARLAEVIHGHAQHLFSMGG